MTRFNGYLTDQEINSTVRNGVMDFKVRDYRAEEEAHSIPRLSVSSHPLSSSSSPHQDSVGGHESIVFFDPLRGQSTGMVEPVEDIAVADKSSTSQATTHLSAKEWASFQKFLMQRFPIPKTILVSSLTSKTIKGSYVIEKLQANTQLDELNDSPKLLEEGFKIVTQQEYITRLHELKDEIMHAWHSDDRVTSLKLTTKVARLLMDTSVAQFYPTLFGLATRIFDMLGDMVWERIKQKAEFAEDGTRIHSLPDDFEAKKICLEAKETCNNWFRKISSIHELLPRIYLELAILPCWRFLNDQVVDNLMRLVMMIRGVADPMVSAYCRLYLVHCAQKLPQRNSGHLITCIDDIKIELMRIVSMKETKYGKFSGDRRLLISLMEPTIEYTMRCIFKDSDQFATMMVKLGLGKNQSELYERVPWISIILHHSIKELPSEVLCSNAMEFLHLIECSGDYSFDQCLNYKMLGLKLCEGISQVNPVDAVIGEVIQVATKRKNLDEYLKILDGYMDIILQYKMDRHLNFILSEIFERSCTEGVTEDELASLQSVVTKIVMHFDNIKTIFSLNYFVDILDVMHGSSRSIVGMHILTKATRNNSIDDPTIIQLLFEVAQSLHDNADVSSLRHADNQQAEHLIARFIEKVDHGKELDSHLAFLVECRGAFMSMNELKETIVHSCNLLATRALRDDKDHLNFVKSCVTFNEVTIPCIPAHSRQLILYLETAEVALLGGLISHSDGLLDSAICCLENAGPGDGFWKSIDDADAIVSLIRKLFSFMLLVPGNLERGVAYIPKSILSILDSKSWFIPRLRMRLLCALVSFSATFAQDELPYHSIHKEVIGNDRLFFGHPMYSQELMSLSSVILQDMVDLIQQEPSQAIRGKLALEACNCIASFFEVNEKISTICSKLLETARLCLGEDDQFSQSVAKFVHKQSTSPVVVGSGDGG